MDNMDLGWGFTLIVLLFFGLVYYIITMVNYLATVFLGRQIEKLTDRVIDKDKKNIFTTAFPFLISATIILIIKLFFIPIDNQGFPVYISGKILFEEPYFFFSTGFFGYIIGMTCLALTRYSFSKNWTIIGRIKSKRTIFNFFLWTTLVIVLTFICRQLSSYYFPFVLVYPVLTIFTTYLFLKWRNMNRPTKDSEKN